MFNFGQICCNLLSYQQVHWLDLSSQFDMTIFQIPGKSNVIIDNMSFYPDLATVGSVESSLLT